MAKNNKSKNKSGGQQHLKPEQYLKQRARLLPIGKCYINTDADEAGLAHIIVTRCHTGGRISMACYLVDMYCLGVKKTFYRLRINEWELKEFINLQPLSFCECSYNEAHNRIYGSIAFAEEGGIEPHKDFQLTQYMLEEDTDDIPLIDYEYGHNGKHYLVCHNYAEANRYLPILHEHLGDDFEYTIEGQDFDDSYDEDDNYDYHNDLENIDDKPVYIRDCIKEYDAEELDTVALCMGIRLNPNTSIQQQQEQYISEVLKDPTDLLMRLPEQDLWALEDLAEEPNTTRLIKYPNIFDDPVMYQMGFLDYVNETDRVVIYRVAEDFWAAVRPHLKEATEDEANKARVTIENIICGLTNLYGIVSVHDTKHYLAKLLEMPYEAASELLEISSNHSAILPPMLCKPYPEIDVNESNYESNMAFSSRFGWDSIPALTNSIAQRDKIAPTNNEFTLEEVVKASSPIPSIPNKYQKEFTHFLHSSLGYGNLHSELICHHLWLRAQHAEDPDNPFGTYLDYFAHEVIDKAPKKPNSSVVNNGMMALQKYMNAMPRWFLKGYTPDEIR